MIWYMVGGAAIFATGVLFGMVVTAASYGSVRQNNNN